MVKKKHTLTLLEVVIALSLTAILLAVLMGSATRLFVFRHRLESAKQEILTKKVIQERLTTLFASLENNRDISTGASIPKPTLYSEDGTKLSLQLDHLIDPEPAFSGKCSATIEVDNEKRLVLTLFGKEEKTARPEEIGRASSRERV